MNPHLVRFGSLVLGLALAASGAPAAADERPARGEARRAARHAGFFPLGDLGPLFDAASLAAEGRRTFRHDTFGDEAFWGDDAAAPRGDPRETPPRPPRSRSG